jgi:hypothetical protein
MSAPRTAITRFDLSFSYADISLIANQKKFIGLKVLPPAPVAMQAASFLRVKIDSLLTPPENLARAPFAAYNRDNFLFDTLTYATQDYGAEETVDDRQLAIYADVIKLENFAALRAVNRVLMGFEVDVASAVFNTGTFSNQAAGSISGGSAVGWDNPADATPLEDIDAARELVLTACGTEPNSLVLSSWALIKLCRTHEIQDLLKFSGHDDPKEFVRRIPALCEVLMLDQILVGRGIKNTANEGQTASPARIWDPTMAMVCAISDSMDVEAPEPTIGRTFMFTDENAEIPAGDDDTPGVIVEEYREEQRRGGTIRARNDRQVQIFHPQAGYLITGVTSGTPA